MYRVNCVVIVFAATAALPATAQAMPDAKPVAGPEIAVGLLAHGIRKPFRSELPTGFDLYQGEEERDTFDVQIVYRTAPLSKVLKPRLTAKLQLNTDGRTNFASVGAEWRQHVLRDRVYGQIGIGLTLHDGYRFTPDPFVAGLSALEEARRFDLYANRVSFGSRVLFNPNLSLGVRLNDRWAVEVAFEHFSHAQVFSKQNPGIDNVGIRLVRVLGRRQ